MGTGKHCITNLDSQDNFEKNNMQILWENLEKNIHVYGYI